MSDTSHTSSTKTRAWSLGGFDLEGVAGAVAAWLVGILLGLLWGPLFWLGFIAAVLVLMASRRATRTPPEDAAAVIAPCDGVVQEIGLVDAPDELRWPAGQVRRLRIASSPASTNMLFAPASGEVETLVAEPGDPSVFIAGKPDMDGLETRFLSLKGEAGNIGLRIASAGLGPRLDVDLEVGDMVKAGRKIGVRRLGGWCDVYLPGAAEIALTAGQTLVGAETVLATGVEPGAPVAKEIEEPAQEETDVPAEEPPAKPAPEPAEPRPKDEAPPADDDTEAATARLYEKLKKEADKAED
ncbi:MAG: phosphatidylserine decarboxylase [Pseudomonadota bacterium]